MIHGSAVGKTDFVGVVVMIWVVVQMVVLFQNCMPASPLMRTLCH